MKTDPRKAPASPSRSTKGPSDHSANLKIYWFSHNRKAKEPPNKNFPNGCHIDLSDNSPMTCTAQLPYPAKECGIWTVVCTACGLRMAVTAAGRRDDPKSLTVACKGGRAYD